MKIVLLTDRRHEDRRAVPVWNCDFRLREIEVVSQRRVETVGLNGVIEPLAQRYTQTLPIALRIDPFARNDQVIRANAKYNFKAADPKPKRIEDLVPQDSARDCRDGRTGNGVARSELKSHLASLTGGARA